MWNIILAQMGERWLQTRKNILVSIPLYCLGACALYLAMEWLLVTTGVRLNASLDWIHQEDAQDFFAIVRVIVVGVYVAISVFLGMFSTMRERSRALLGFPARRFRLPISTPLLVACPMAYGFVVSTLAYALFSTVFTHITGSIMPSVWFVAPFAGTLSVALHAADWSVAGPVRRACCMAFVAYALGAWLLAQGDIRSRGFVVALCAEEVAFSWSDYAFLLGCGAASLILAIWNVGRHRRGERIEIPSLDLMFSPQPAKWCTSPARALFWFEMTRTGVILAVLNVATLTVLMLARPIALYFLDMSSQSLQPIELLAIYAMLSFVELWLVAPIISAGYGRQETAYHMTRPMAVGDIVKVKFLATTCAPILVWLLVPPVGILWLVLWGIFAHPPVLTTGYIEAFRQHWIEIGLFIVACPAIAWTYMGFVMGTVFLAPTSTVRSQRFNRLSTALGCICIALYVLFGWDNMTERRLLLFWQILAVAVGVGLLTSVTVLLGLARRRGYLSRRGLFLAIGVWLLFLAALAVLSVHDMTLDWRHIAAAPKELMPFGFLHLCFIVLPLAPFGFVPLCFARLRHQ